MITWQSDTPGDVPEWPARVHRNGHILALEATEWRCLHCRHYFDAASDADAFWCGEACACEEPS